MEIFQEMLTKKMYKKALKLDSKNQEIKKHLMNFMKK